MKDRLWMWVPIVLGLLAFVLSATRVEGQQQSTTVLTPDIEVTVNGDTTVVNVNVMTDSTMLARLNENLEALREQIAASDCNTCGGASTTNKIAVGIVIPVLIWIAMELRGIKNKDDIHNVENNVDVDVTVERKKKHDSEGDSES